MDEFARALPQVLIHEGGYSNHPKDPGGATMKGVTQRVYDDFRKTRKRLPQSVRLITAEEISTIYRERYWELVKGDLLPAGIGYVVFDGAVNSGVGRSPKWLQRALVEAGLYNGQIDGLVGPGTIEAVNNHPDHDKLIARIYEIRLAFLKSLETWPTFGRGWKSRIDGVKAVGQAWATGSVAPQLHFVEGGNAKALETSAKKAPSTAPGDAAAGGGALTTALSQAREQLEPLSTFGNVSTILTYLAVAGLIVTVGGIAYRMWAKRKADKLKEAMS